MKNSYIVTSVLVTIILGAFLLGSVDILVRGDIIGFDARLVQMLVFFTASIFNLFYAIWMIVKKDKFSMLSFLYIGALFLLCLTLGALSALTYGLTSTGPLIGI